MSKVTLTVSLLAAGLYGCTVPAPATDDGSDTPAAGGSAGQASAGAAGKGGSGTGGVAGAGSAGATSGGGGSSSGGSSGSSAGIGGTSGGSAGATPGGTSGAAGGGASGASGGGAGGAAGVTGGGGQGGGAAGAPIGETCADPIVIPAVPFVVDASTIGFTNEYGVDAGMCAGVATAQGHASPDTVYRFTPGESGIYDVLVEPSKIPTLYDPLLYVATTCPVTKVSCLAASDEIPSVSTGGKELLTLTLTAGQSYFVFVDGTYDKNATAEGTQGNYKLSITKKP